MFIQAFAPLHIYLQKACQKDKTLNDKHLQKNTDIRNECDCAQAMCIFAHTHKRVSEKNILLLKYFVFEFARSVISYNFIHYL